MLTIQKQPGLYTIYKLDSSQVDVTKLLENYDFFSFTVTKEEFSLVCREGVVKNYLQAESGWNLFKVIGPLEFELIGIIAEISKPLAESGISIFTISTYDTDYFLVKEAISYRTIQKLKDEGFEFV